MNETMTDRELDAWLAEHLFGWADVDAHYESRRWEFTDPPYEPVTEGRGREPVEADPDIKWRQPKHRLHFAVFPAYSSTGEGMLMVIEAMRERGDAVEIVCPSALAFQVTVYQSWGNGDRRVRSESPSLPRAVAEAAARSALESGA